MTALAQPTLLPNNPTRFLRRLRIRMMHRKVRAAMAYGVLSGLLYFGLFHFSGDIKAIAEATNRGDKSLFLLPIGIAFLFSVVHGLFTDRFWEAMGLKAKG